MKKTWEIELLVRWSTHQTFKKVLMKYFKNQNLKTILKSTLNFLCLSLKLFSKCKSAKRTQSLPMNWFESWVYKEKIQIWRDQDFKKLDKNSNPLLTKLIGITIWQAASIMKKKKSSIIWIKNSMFNLKNLNLRMSLS